MPDFPFHYQDCGNYCAAASLMMMLEAFGVDPDSQYQSELMQDIDDESAMEGDSFASPPEAVVAVANDILSADPSIDVRYSIYPAGINPLVPTTSPPATAQACVLQIRAAVDSSLPVFVLAKSGDHWILVFDRKAKYHVRSPDTKRTVCVAKLPHDDGCTECGAGSAEVWSVTELRNHITLNQRPLPPGFFRQRVLLVPSKPPAPPAPELFAMMAAPSDGEDGESPRQCPEQSAAAEDEEDPPDGSEPLSPAAAQALVETTRHTYATDFVRHGQILAGKSARVGPAILVQVLDVDDRNYYLVPVFADGELPFFVFMVDAMSGAIRRVIGTRADKPGLERWIFQKPEFPAGAHPGWVPDRLVWKHCQESLSPFRPLLRVRKGDATGFFDPFGDDASAAGVIHTQLTRANDRPPRPRQPDSSKGEK